MPFKSAWLGVLLALAVAAPAAAEFPDRPIRIMAPYPPGGNIDVTARIIADKLKDMLGVTVLVENKAGASGTIGGDVIARSAPDGYNLTTNHIVIELVSDAPRAKYTIVHSKVSGQASVDVITGQMPAQVDQLNSSLGHIKAGKLRALAVSSEARVPELPDVPTFRESGIPELKDFTYATFTGLFGPAKMPPQVVKKLDEAMVKVLTDPATVKKFADLTAIARPSTPDELAALLDTEDRAAVPVIKKLGKVEQESAS